jgi:hypothetical protein
MNYDAWKTGHYEDDCDAEKYCTHNHTSNREVIKDLIDALYAKDSLNTEFIVDQLYCLANDYEIDFDYERPLEITLKNPKPKKEDTYFNMMVDINRAQAKAVNFG